MKIENMIISKMIRLGQNEFPELHKLLKKIISSHSNDIPHTKLYSFNIQDKFKQVKDEEVTIEKVNYIRIEQ